MSLPTINLDFLESPSVLNGFSVTTDEEADRYITMMLEKIPGLKDHDEKILLLCKKIVTTVVGDASVYFGPEEFNDLLSIAIEHNAYYKEIIALTEHILHSLDFEPINENDIPAEVYLDAGLAIGSLSSENWVESFKTISNKEED
jgi:hypothetical protein